MAASDRPPRLPPMHAVMAFEAAARLGTFSKAAEELCVTQSAVSHRIRQLEEHLGAPMFVRVHNAVLLTPQGERFLESAREALRHLAAGAESITGVAAKLRITSTPAMASHVLIPRLQEFLTAHPDLQLEIDTSSRMVDMNAGAIDVAIRYGAGPWPGLQQELLLAESVLVLASPEYAGRFAAHAGSEQRLAKATLIHNSAFSWDTWRAAVGYSFPVPASSALMFQEVRAALDAAVHGLGVVLTTQLASLDFVKRGLLVPFVDDVVDLQKHYYVLYRADSPRVEEVRTFARWLEECVREMASSRAVTARAG